MSEKRFVQVGDTSIKDTLTGEEWYAPCEDGLLELLNEQQDTISALKDENEQLKHWNNCLAEKRHEEKEHNDNLIKKLIGKIDFLERIIEGNL